MKTNPPEGQLDQISEQVKVEATKVATEAEYFAGSLVELAKVGGGLDIVDRDLRLIKETIGGHMDLKRTLSEGELPSENKQAVIDGLFRNKISDVTLNFLQLIVGLGRVELLGEIAESFAARLEAEENKVVAEVTTASPLDVKFSRSLAKKLSLMSGREVTIRSKVDPELVGGILVRIGDKLLDGSVRNQLARMREQMLVDMRGK